MGLLTYEQIEDGFDATANLWNSRFAPLYDELNGKLNTQNLATKAVEERNIATKAVTANKIGVGAVLPSKMNNVWVGKTSSKSNVTTSDYVAFNKTITLDEASYVYVLLTASGNANNTTVDPSVKILVNDIAVANFTGDGALELWTAKTNADFPFSASAITDDKLSGNVNIKVVARSSNSNGWDLSAEFIRIDALSDGANLG